MYDVAVSRTITPMAGRLMKRLLICLSTLLGAGIFGSRRSPEHGTL